MSPQAITDEQGKPYMAGEKGPAEASRRWSRRFLLVLAAALLVVIAVPGSVTQAPDKGASRESASLLGTLAVQARGVAASGARFVSDLRLLYQIAQLRNGLGPRAAASLPKLQAVGAPAEIKVCAAARAALPAQSKSGKLRS